MKTLLQILKERKLQLFFLLYVLMPVPVLSLLAQNLSLSAVAVGIGLSLLLLCVVFLLASFMTTRGLKIFYSLLLAVTIIPGTILIGYLFIGHVLLSGGTITSIFETNTDEASEFIAYLNPWLVTAVTLFVLTPIVMICRMKQPERFFRIRRHKYAFFALVFVALLFVTVRPVAQRIYFVDFYRVFAHYKIGRFREERALARRHTLPFEVRTQPDKTPRLVVLVIGESHARRHMSLYGYPRDTNPLLSARRGELSVYTDVVSPQVHTIPVLRAALTFADWDHPERLTTYPSLIELFNRAGFETYVISNQPLLDGSSSYDAFLKLADHTVDLAARNAAAAGHANIHAAEATALAAELKGSGAYVDLIWSNPPVRIGKAALHEMLLTWLGLLSDDGEAWLVVSRNLGADSLMKWLAAQGHDVERAASSKGFRVLRVGRPDMRAA